MVTQCATSLCRPVQVICQPTNLRGWHPRPLTAFVPSVAVKYALGAARIGRHSPQNLSLITAAAAGAPAGATLGDEFFARDKRPIILFDGVCNL